MILREICCTSPNRTRQSRPSVAAVTTTDQELSGPLGTVCFTFDFDAEEVWLADQPDAALRPSVLSQGAYGARRGVDAILGLLSRYDVTATFFVPGRVAERHPQVVKRVLLAGHEIGHHGYTHREPAGLSAAEEAEELEAGQEALRNCGASVTGYRAPGWAVSTRTLELLKTHGFTYSSNFMDDVHPYRHSPSGIVEVPVHWCLDDAPFLWFSTGDWSRTMMPNTVLHQIFEAELTGIIAVGGVCTLTFHPQLIGRPGRLAVLEQLLRWCSDNDSLVATCNEVAVGADALEVHDG